ncbi:MAG TPA: hypothetical protein VKS79_14315 [Gemmataceae bacterium]|nr:hypothetical protein [Gemmataceae bacterium]
MPKVFVSYQREDSGCVTGCLYEHLARKYGEANVFMDVHTIGLAADFRQTVEGALSKCDVFVLGFRSKPIVEVTLPRLGDETKH